ncbi:MAG: 16S rRNA (cytosine(967)-C(5))-methyltransferase RsmB [Acidobacteria bacterium]|nr:16S rRNA (cytosine(967)-C(5))-methyltransferase RsmB [Acidobacteriota bacterium]
MNISPARKIAFDILLRVASGGEFASDLLFEMLKDDVRSDDAGLATELTLGVLRRQRILDFLIERLRGKSLGSLDAEVLIALRLGMYQLRYLDRVPASAAVNESVELVKRAKKTSAATLVNAILRKAGSGESPLARMPVESLISKTLPLDERLGIEFSHPDWMVSRYLQTLGETQTRALLQANNQHPAFCVSVFSPVDEMQQRLAQAEIQWQRGKWLKQSLTIQGGGPTLSELIREGHISIQDEASQMIPLLVSVQPGDMVLDLCSGQGGKSRALLDAAGKTGAVISADHRSENLRALQKRMPESVRSNSQLVVLDATQPLPFGRTFDKILVDVPCSGTGTLSRNPEIRWRLKEEHLSQFQKKQFSILSQAAQCVKPAGRLVYATCSLEPEENELVIRQFLQSNHEFNILRDPAALAKHLLDSKIADSFFSEEGFFRTFPPVHFTDGFFAAILQRHP